MSDGMNDTKELVTEFLMAIGAFYLTHEPSRSGVYKVLDALAYAAATVVEGTGPEREEVRRWFNKRVVGHRIMVGRVLHQAGGPP
jgi:hypothetical protein